ncbi:MAG: cbb3-type cytochrome oxidase assembly protein CcoS [Bacteroidetes bacterium]|nr:cbb3-type cytochrome oxidase assembly protein CcoS [Bacteroidota bacterium]
MYVMFVLIGFSLLVAIIFLVVFIWAVRSGQYEDQYTPSVRAIFDDETRKKSKNEESSKPDNQEQRSTD